MPDLWSKKIEVPPRLQKPRWITRTLPRHIKSPQPLPIFSSFLLHTYLVGTTVIKQTVCYCLLSCIAHRGDGGDWVAFESFTGAIFDGFPSWTIFSCIDLFIDVFCLERRIEEEGLISYVSPIFSVLARVGFVVMVVHVGALPEPWPGYWLWFLFTWWWLFLLFALRSHCDVLIRWDLFRACRDGASRARSC